MDEDILTAQRREVVEGLEDMIAIARCNEHSITAYSVASHAVHRFAVVLESESDRSKMLDYLEEIKVRGWRPVESSIHWLKWQWDSMSHYKYDSMDSNEWIN